MAYNLESFCPEPWSQIEISLSGDYKICCLAHFSQDFGMAMDKNGNIMNVLTHSFQEALNSETHKEQRLDYSNNVKPQRCRNCYDSEDSTRRPEKPGGISKRQRLLTETAIEIPEYVTIDTVDQFTQPDGSVNSKIVNLHLRFGNLCNYKCLMCSPNSSNLWYDDWVAIQKPGIKKNVFSMGYKKYAITKDEHDRSRMDFPAWWETDIWWERFTEIMPQLRYIYFTGGEPFLVPALGKCLDMLIEADLAKDITLRFDTNLSVFNNKIISRLEKFKKIIMCVSIDETGERYNLVRNGGDWDNFIKNLKILKSTDMHIEYISASIGIATLYVIPRVCEVSNEYKVRAFFRFLEGPKWLDIRYLPTSAKQEIIEKYQELEKNNTNPNHTFWYKSVYKLLNKYMDESFTNYEHLNEFVRVMDILDSTRNLNWRETLPDTYDLLKRHCGSKLIKL